MSQQSLTRLSRFASFLFGFLLPWKAFRLIFSKPSLLLWSSLPVLITTGVYVFFILKSQAVVVGYLSQALIHHGLDPNSWLMKVVNFIILHSLLILGIITFAVTATLISCPFNDFLAEATEPLATPPLPLVRSGGFRRRLRLLALDMAKTFAAVSVGILAILVSWVPIVNFLALLISFLLVCFQFISYPQSRRGEGIRDGAAFLFKHFYASLGFGSAVTALFAIPLISCLFLPVAVVGGTLLVARASAHGTFPRLR